MPDSKRNPVAPVIALAAALFMAGAALCFIAAPALAADPIFPTGSRVGLVPPDGMTVSDKFEGFSDPNEDAAILMNVLPAEAYAQLEKTIDVEAAKKQGVHLDKREPITLSAGKGILLSGSQVAEGAHYRKYLLILAASDLTVLLTIQVPDTNARYSDQAVRASLATLAVRAKVPESEELALLPFEVSDLAGFHIDGVLRGRALMLSDPPAGATPDAKSDASDNARAHMLIAAVPGGPNDPADRGNFARLSFDEIGGIRSVHLTMSEPLRVNGQAGYQTMADAQDARTGADVKVVQWLRFGGNGFLQMVAIAPADSWVPVLARLRTVRDSVELK